jgi:hypothetical protein
MSFLAIAAAKIAAATSKSLENLETKGILRVRREEKSILYSELK